MHPRSAYLQRDVVCLAALLALKRPGEWNDLVLPQLWCVGWGCVQNQRVAWACSGAHNRCTYQHRYSWQMST